jgi:hypothetical protein
VFRVWRVWRLLRLICVVCPVLETFDSWDHTIQTGNDSEYALVVLALCVGAAYSFARASLQYNLASVYPVRKRWFPTLEFNGRRLDAKNAFYLTPGLYRHFSHRLEIGMGVPTGVGGVAGRIGVVGKMTWEIGGDKD